MAYAQSSDDTADNAVGRAPLSFDPGMLKSLGIDPALAEYFTQAPRFLQGYSRVSLEVNGRKAGQAQVFFDAQGELCFEPGLLQRARLKAPARGVPRAATGSLREPECLDFLGAYPRSIVNLKPNAGVVELIVPSDALAAEEHSLDLDQFGSGGAAAIWNYEVFSSGNLNQAGVSRYHMLANEVGVNAANWIVRSRNSYRLDGPNSKFTHLYAYAQRSYAEQQGIFQVGEINVGNSIFPGPPIYGMQWLPESGLPNTSGSGAAISGIAQSQARVEVRQSGALIHTALVPAGPFTLTDIPLLNRSSDLEVSVIEADGATRTFSVSAATLFAGGGAAAPGYAVSVGKLRSFGGGGGRTAVAA